MESSTLLHAALEYIHIKEHRALLLGDTHKLITLSNQLYPTLFPGVVYKKSWKRWTFPSGATIEFDTVASKEDAFRHSGMAYSFIGFHQTDNPPTEFTWEYMRSRLRTTNPKITCVIGRYDL